jgi:hypothetical protein
MSERDLVGLAVRYVVRASEYSSWFGCESSKNLPLLGVATQLPIKWFRINPEAKRISILDVKDREIVPTRPLLFQGKQGRVMICLENYLEGEIP